MTTNSPLRIKTPLPATPQEETVVAPAPAPRREASRRRRKPGWRDRLLDPRVQAPLLLMLVALAALFAWQVRRPFALDLGAPNDDPYLGNFHAAETASGGGLTYRWSRDRSTITVPGYGATEATLTLRIAGGRPGGAPPPKIAVTAGDQPATEVQLTAEPRDYQFAIPATAFSDGSLRVTVAAPAFRPAGDRRDLGVVVDRAELRDASAPRGLIAPPLRVLGTLLLATLLAYGTVATLPRSRLAAALAGWSAAAALLVIAVRSRFELALFAPALAAVSAAVAAVTLLLGLALWRGRDRWGWPASVRTLGGAALVAGLSLFALLAGMRHPQFRSSDLTLNVHRLEFVERGEWVFTLALPGPRALQAPYPPAFYAALLPFARLGVDRALLVECAAALAVAAGALLTFALARRVTGADGAALWAAGGYAVAPIAYAMASAGNFANLFGQFLANVYLVALILTYGHWRHPVVAMGLTAALASALLGHFGVFLSLLATLPLLIAALAFRSGERRRQAFWLAGSAAVALLAAYTLYYRFHTDLVLGHLRDFVAGRTDAQGDSPARAGLARQLAGQARGMVLWWGWPAVPLAAIGVNLLRRARRSPALTLTLTWLATVLPFALLEIGAGLSVRYHLFVLPALAIAAGWALWRLTTLHRYAGPALAAATGALWLWQALALWVDRVLHAYH